MQHQPILTCDSHGILARSGPGITIRHLAATDPDELLRQFIRTQALAFGEGSARGRARPADLGRKREDLLAGAQRCCLGFVGGEAAGAGSSLVAGDTCEIAGIGTLPRWRGRGVASAIVGALVREHFQKGGNLAWLSAADERAGSVYRGIGFHPTGALQATCDRPAS